MKKALSLLLCAALLLSPALAADYPDLPPEHWAYVSMDRAHTLGILTGQPDGSMQPASPLTWGQFLTLLARAFYPDVYSAQAPGGHWAAGAYRAAGESGLLLSEDILPVTEATLDDPILRQDAVVLLSRLLPAPDASGAPAFSDWDALPQSYHAPVAAASAAGLVSGMPDGTFSGAAPLSRADGAILVMRLYDRRAANPAPPPTETDPPEGDIPPQESLPPAEPAPPVDPYLQQDAALELVSTGEMTWEQYWMQDFWLKLPGESQRKCQFLFGDPNKRRFSSKEEADANMAEVTVPVWRLDRGTGVKTSSTATLTVHAALAGEVTAIFTEIYNDPEQFPIKNLGGYDWRGASSKGEHNCGTAIDINWEENYQVYSGGRVGAGSYWKPGDDPFSIPQDGSVVRIFALHGFSWGGSAWDTSKDYMHFSYLGK